MRINLVIIISLLLLLLFNQLPAQILIIDQPSQDTIIDEVIIKGRLINNTKSKLEYSKFRGDCNTNSVGWWIMITKGKTILKRIRSISESSPESFVLKKNEIYNFDFCVNINTLVPTGINKSDFKKEGEYIIWIRGTTYKKASNKIKVYFKSSQK